MNRLFFLMILPVNILLQSLSAAPQHGSSKVDDAVMTKSASASHEPSASRHQVFTYPNGLTLIVQENHSAPVASVQAWCKTGSIHEGQLLGAGLSHIP